MLYHQTPGRGVKFTAKRYAPAAGPGRRQIRWGTPTHTRDDALLGTTVSVRGTTTGNGGGPIELDGRLPRRDISPIFSTCGDEAIQRLAAASGPQGVRRNSGVPARAVAMVPRHLGVGITRSDPEDLVRELHMVKGTGRHPFAWAKLLLGDAAADAMQPARPPSRSCRIPTCSA